MAGLPPPLRLGAEVRGLLQRPAQADQLQAERQAGRVQPRRTLMPGRPARFTVTVKMSLRYMATGSSALSPRLKAAEGAVGVSRASTFSHACSKSSAMRRRTFRALR